jgi:Fe-S-cluster containining protein
MNLVQVQSGTIDLQFDGKTLAMEFNCSCEDALPYCQALCCRMRTFYGVEVTEAEKNKFDVMYRDGKLVLSSRQDNDACSYLDGNSCMVHSIKPERCKEWHCSPNGVGEGIKVRGTGWLLIKKEHAS